jgi:hypothetical protein
MINCPDQKRLNYKKWANIDLPLHCAAPTLRCPYTALLPLHCAACPYTALLPLHCAACPYTALLPLHCAACPYTALPLCGYKSADFNIDIFGLRDLIHQLLFDGVNFFSKKPHYIIRILFCKSFKVLKGLDGFIFFFYLGI